MTFPKVLFASAVALSVTFFSACTANSAETSSALLQSNNYLKPGAAVTYSHNLKSQLSAGTTTTFQLSLGESYEGGTLNVTLSTEGDISLFAASTQASFDMLSENKHDMDISVTANANGRHYINVVASAVNPSGQSQPRIFSIPVQVGPVTAMKPDPNLKVLDTGEAIIEMTAQEEIK